MASHDDTLRCQVFGCYRSLTDPPTEITVHINNTDVVKKVCPYHEELLSTMDPTTYDVGLNYITELEIRIHPATPQG